ncbi:MAG: hypothetical protein ABWY64_26190 [Tardiphaga sp.]
MAARTGDNLPEHAAAAARSTGVPKQPTPIERPEPTDPRRRPDSDPPDQPSQDPVIEPSHDPPDRPMQDPVQPGDDQPRMR